MALVNYTFCDVESKRIVVALTCVDAVIFILYTLVITDQSNVKLYPFSVNGRYYKWQNQTSMRSVNQ